MRDVRMAPKVIMSFFVTVLIAPSFEKLAEFLTTKHRGRANQGAGKDS